MKQRKSSLRGLGKHDVPAPPGCIFTRGARLWWRGKLPGVATFSNRPIVPEGQHFALPDSEANRRIAAQIVWRWWNNASADQSGTQTVFTVTDLAAAYLAHAKIYYRNAEGQPTGEANNIQDALKILISEYGTLPADRIGKTEVRAVRQRMIETGLARTTINKRISIIKRMYRWAVDDEDYVPETTYYAVAVVKNLKENRSAAPEPKKIRPADDLSVQWAMLELPPVLRDMVRLQRLTGMRSTELCTIKPEYISRHGDVWHYRPKQFKSKHLGHERVIVLGPQAQELLKPYMARRPDQFCFTPAEAQAQRNISGNVKADHYNRRSYRYAIVRVFGRVQKKYPAFKKWSPHHVRRRFLNAVRDRFDSDIARAAGGHSTLNATENYLEQDIKNAEKAARLIG